MATTQGEGRRRARMLAVLLAAFACSCRGTLGPVPPPVPREQVLAALQGRSDRLQTILDTRISLKFRIQTEKGVESQPTLGGVLAFDRQRGALWLRAEKIGQKIFDLHAVGDRFHLEIPNTKEVVTGGPLAYHKVPYLIHPYEVMMWLGAPEWLGLTAGSTSMTVEEEDYRFGVLGEGLLTRTVYVSRRHLGVSRIVDYDLLGRVRTEVSMDKYEQVNGIVFPHHLAIARPLQGCWIRLKLGKPKFNKELKKEVFEHREKHGWRHIDLDREPLSNVEAFGGKR